MMRGAGRGAARCHQGGDRTQGRLCTNTGWGGWGGWGGDLHGEAVLQRYQKQFVRLK